MRSSSRDYRAAPLDAVLDDEIIHLDPREFALAALRFRNIGGIVDPEALAERLGRTRIRWSADASTPYVPA